jgi:hypothetical protein
LDPAAGICTHQRDPRRYGDERGLAEEAIVSEHEEQKAMPAEAGPNGSPAVPETTDSNPPRVVVYGDRSAHEIRLYNPKAIANKVGLRRRVQRRR